MKMQKLRVLELFGGVSSVRVAMNRLNINYEIVDYVEIDKYAVMAYNAMFDESYEPCDIQDWDKDVEVDFIMQGSPCQDISLAGLQKGLDEDSETRSSLLWETIRIIEKLKPKYVIWEQVKNVLSDKHKHNYHKYVDTLAEMGYTNHAHVLNAKDYGVAQNRERLFTISILNDTSLFLVPIKQVLTKSIKNYLEDEVDEKYYLSDKLIAGFEAHKKRNREKGNGFGWEIKDGNRYANCIENCTQNRPSSNFIKVAGKLNTNSFDQVNKVYNKNGISPTIDTTTRMRQGVKIIDDTYKTVRDDREYAEVSPAIRANRYGFKVSEPVVVASRGRPQSDGTNKQELEINDSGSANTITSVAKDNYVKVVGNYMPSGHNASRIVDTDGIAPTVKENHETVTAITQDYVMYNPYNDTEIKDIAPTQTVNCGSSNCNATVQIDNGFSIRKLTSRETWRLQDFEDYYYDRASKVVSESQLYKQSGNAICVNCLCAIFESLFSEYTKGVQDA